MPTTDPQDGDPVAKPPQLLDIDARGLRALAHPLRLNLLNSLRESGPATASGLAERLGESSGATSYHLRQLAAYGFVEDDPTLGKGRERWWRAVHVGASFGPEFLYDPDPEVRGAMGNVLQWVASVHAQEVGHWIGTTQDWSRAWFEASDLSDFKVRLTPELSRQLADEIHALINSYRGRVSEETEGSAVVRTHLHMFPRSTS
ncbi:helix-turn-helix domain-containing protein [Streptomyces sp. NPDC059783]|uniref:helix-turn-helix domain-containing protein n=1 Tax=Streptomyces sp. NPDC059783 TaxID=3346944 RepID=UPI0036658F93